MNNFNIPSILKQLRKTSGYVAKDVTKKLRDYGISISEKTLYGYESGLSMPNADAFVALCRIYKCDNPLDIFGHSEITAEELNHIKKYRTLDQYGQDTVSAVLDHELKRCQEQAVTKHEEKAVDLVSEKRIIKIAGRDGSFTEMHLTDDQIKALQAYVDQLPDASDLL